MSHLMYICALITSPVSALYFAASARRSPMPNFDQAAWEQQRDEVEPLKAREFRHLILPIEDRMRILLSLIAKDLRPCRDCGEMIAVVKHRSGRSWPYSLDGVNHKMHCPKREISK